MLLSSQTLLVEQFNLFTQRKISNVLIINKKEFLVQLHHRLSSTHISKFFTKHILLPQIVSFDKEKKLHTNDHFIL